jgi:hypothetical protein
MNDDEDISRLDAVSYFEYVNRNYILEEALQYLPDDFDGHEAREDYIE